MLSRDGAVTSVLMPGTSTKVTEPHLPDHERAAAAH
jgi:hypothetical protein